MDLKKLNLFLLSGFYVFAGVNHFINPQFYYDLIPDYLPFHELINVVSGLAEIILGIGVIFQKTRKWSSYLLVTMLISFIPAHIYFIQIGSCVEGGMCVSEWIGWARLLIIHPLLIWWALSVTSTDK
jgi:uncharacterized membrane protein